VTIREFDRILVVHVIGRAYVEKIDIQRADVVVVGKVLRLNLEYNAAPLDVQPGCRNIFFRSYIPVLCPGIGEAVAANF
jgi:hypothetical protein